MNSEPHTRVLVFLIEPQYVRVEENLRNIFVLSAILVDAALGDPLGVLRWVSLVGENPGTFTASCRVSAWCLPFRRPPSLLKSRW